MANKCEICGKSSVSGNNVSHSNRKTRKTIKPNLCTVHVVENGVKKTKKVCTRCLRSNKVTKVMKQSKMVAQ